MFFFILSNANIDFLEQELKLRTHTIKKAFLITKQVELVEIKDFATVILNPEHEIFIIYIVLLTSSNLGVLPGINLSQ